MSNVNYILCFDNIYIIYVIDVSKVHWFKFTDIGQILKLRNISKYSKIILSDYKSKFRDLNLSYELNVIIHPDYLFVNIYGVCELILRSKRFESLRFLDWIFSKIEKHEYYDMLLENTKDSHLYNLNQKKFITIMQNMNNPNFITISLATIKRSIQSFINTYNKLNYTKIFESSEPIFVTDYYFIIDELEKEKNIILRGNSIEFVNNYNISDFLYLLANI